MYFRHHLLSDKGATLEILDFAFYIGTNFLYFISTLPTQLAHLSTTGGGVCVKNWYLTFVVD